MSDPFGFGEPGQGATSAPRSRREARESAAAAGEPVRPAADSRRDRPEPGERGGIAGVIAKHPRAWLATALATAFVLLGTGAVFAGIAVGGSDQPTVTAPIDPADQVAERDVPGEIPPATDLRTCTVTQFASDPRLMTLRGEVVDTGSGEVLFDRGGANPARPASAVKLITAAAALNALGPDHRFSTAVFEGTAPGQIVLVGGGDATLNSRESGENVYKGAPTLNLLAQLALQGWVEVNGDEPITSLVLDATLWNPSDKWDASWSRSEQTRGYLSEVTALQVDGDRADPTKLVSPRSTDPVARAGAAFVRALERAGLDNGPDAPPITVTLGTNTSPTKLGEVQSQPLSTLVVQMLLASDGTLAEMMARATSIKMGLAGASGTIGQAVTGALSPLQLDTDNLTVVDGSGFSANNAVAPDFFVRLLELSREGTNQLSYVYNGLSEAGKTGTMVDRFRGSSAVARDAVVAKTGKIATAQTLTGIVVAKDGTVLSFALYAIGEGITDDAKAALDDLVAGFYSCGANLSNN